jgi:redox-sensing transcriptional repressor
VAIPRPTVRRFSLYLRETESLLESGTRTVSSGELSALLALNDAQVRRDLGHLGVRGRPGIGYRLTPLIDRLRGALGVDRSRNVVIIGAGRIGRALIEYPRFGARGFRIVAVFDTNPKLIGRQVDGHTVRGIEDLASIIEAEDIEMGIIAVPESAAESVAESLVAAGVTGLLNFAPCRLDVDAEVVDVDLSSSLEELAAAIASRADS